jgi:hypothetical protein
LLLEHLAISRHLLRIQNCFDLLVGAIPDCAHLGRLRSRCAAAIAACTIWRSAAAPPTTSTSTASSTAPATTLPTTLGPLTARIFSEGLDIHCFVRED